MQDKEADYEIPIRDMPIFLNKLAEKIDDPEIKSKLAQCSAFIFGVTAVWEKKCII